MKKTLMMAVMAAMATSALAQDNLVKQAQKECTKGELEQALKTLTPAISSSETLDKAAAWNLMNEIQYQLFLKGQTTETENKLKQTNTPFDTLGMHKAVVAALEAAMKCDGFDRQPNEKGKVKIRFRKANQERYKVVRPNTINAGMFAYNHKDMAGAIKAWKLYIDSATDPLFEGVDMSNDQYRSEIAYYVGLAAYQTKDYATATKYAKLAAQDPKKEKDANEILLFAQKDGCKTKEDSLAYLQTIKDLHAKDPGENRYFNLLMDYYSKPGRQKEMLEWCNEEITTNPNNKMVWALKGESEMNQSKWDDAIASYKKAAEIDPSFVQVIFNTGVCLNSKAIEMKDKLADKKTGNLTTANFNKIKAILTESLTYLEKVKELDPSREKVNWAYPLYQIYYSLGDKAKSAEMEKLLGNK